MKHNTFKLVFKSMFAAGILSLTACGPQAYVAGVNSSDQVAAGNANIPAKVDIVLGISENGTMNRIYSSMLPEIQAFLTSLQASGWDYRFVAIPLTEDIPTTIASGYSANGTVSASKYASNWGGSWIAPFPNAIESSPAFMVPSSLFTFNSTFPSAISQVFDDGHESGFQSELDFLNRSDINNANPGSGMLRSDALLAVITLSNADDRSDGYWNPNYYNETGTPTHAPVWQQTDPNDLQHFENQFIALKGGSASLMKYYSLVSPTTTCRTQNSLAGIRYTSVATALGGQAIDICQNTLSAALSLVQANLQNQKLTYVKDFLMIGTQPDPTTIKVIKYSNGVATTLPQDANNGWTYYGYGTVYTIESPTPMDQETGYAIQLHGSAVLTGADSADVQYTNAGTK
jgi:hypothetical protein